MNAADALAFAALVASLAVVIGVLADVYKRHLAFKERKLELMARQSAEHSAQAAAHSERLEQRLRVLERIVTDSGYDVATRIDALRDPATGSLPAGLEVN